MFDYDDPFVLFDDWFEEAKKAEPRDPNAMTVSTIGGDGYPDSRVVLMKQIHERSFVFYTNSKSAKGQQLRQTPKAAANFYWKTLNRQVRIIGDIVKAPDELADAYFNTRSMGSKIGAWASQQSQPLKDRFELEQQVAKLTEQYSDGKVPRPPHWYGYQLLPYKIEFWQDRPFRLHDRLRFSKSGDHWGKTRLYP